MANRNIHLVIIDPQNDFCDLPDNERPRINGVQQTPALPVTGAHADMQRVARLIREGGAGLSHISITLDSHQRVDIAHPPFWQQANGEAVAPFTQISAEEVKAGRYLPRQPGSLERVLAYLEALEAQGRYRHMVWPVHCEIGTWGHDVHEAVRSACDAWEVARSSSVNKIIKGTNPWTEHYSAIEAEIPDPADASTCLNTAFMAQLRAADLVLITGEAGSHCVKATTEHILAHYDKNRSGHLMLLSDCMSPVTGFEAHYQGFLEAMQKLGVQIVQSPDVLPLLLENV